jgi:hypothetical protein
MCRQLDRLVPLPAGNRRVVKPRSLAFYPRIETRAKEEMHGKIARYHAHENRLKYSTCPTEGVPIIIQKRKE